MIAIPKSVYKAGYVYEFKIRKLFSTYCEVIDEVTGVTTYLHGTGSLRLFKGQTIKCRVISVKEKHPRLELVDIDEFQQKEEGLTEEKLSDFLAHRELSWNTKDFVKLILTDETEKAMSRNVTSGYRIC